MVDFMTPDIRRNKMNEEQFKKMIEDNYDNTKEDSLRSMLSEFYSRKMRSTAILVWANFLFFLALAIISGILFFKADQTKYQIMYAAFFICFAQWSTLTKIFAWQVTHKNSITREIKRLEMRIAELSQTVEDL